MNRIIPAGYSLIVHSWECDSDNHKTATVYGLTKAETKLIVEIIKLFRSRNDHVAGKKFYGNIHDPREKDITECYDAIQCVLDKHPTPTTGDLSEYFSDPDGVHQWLYDIGLSGGEFWTRVLDGYKVEYYPQELEIQDVTGRFK